MLQQKKHPKIISILSSIVLIGVVFVAGIYVGYANQPAISQVAEVSDKEPLTDKKVSFSPYWQVWRIISDKYPDIDDVSTEDRLWGSIAGLVESLDDPYSTFLPPQESKTFQENISGEFGGVGIEVGMKDGVMTVISPLKGTPGDRAGLQPGDQIIRIEDTATANISLDDAVTLIRGEKGTSVTLTISPKDSQETKEVSIERATIEIPVIDTAYEANGDVFAITLYNFSVKAHDEFTEAITEFRHSDANKLLLDLRGNPGGYLEGSIDIASHFLDAGKKVVIERYNTQREDKVYRSSGGVNIAKEKEDFDMVVLVNYGSASASEILAGALQEHDVATLVGEETYGKGSVQELIPITADTSLKLTVAKWFTPGGRSISENGLTPDHVISLTEEQVATGDDAQRNKALELLTD